MLMYFDIWTQMQIKKIKTLSIIKITHLEDCEAVVEVIVQKTKGGKAGRHQFYWFHFREKHVMHSLQVHDM